MNPSFYPLAKADGEEKEKIGKEILATIEKEIEPLLKGAGPFFGGSETLTLAEVSRQQSFTQIDQI